MARLPALNTDFVPDVAAAQQNALRTRTMQAQNTLAGRKLEDYGTERNFLSTQRQNEAADRRYDISRRPVMEAKEGLAVLKQLAPGMDLNTYIANRDMIKQSTGLDDALLPTAEQIQANAEEYDQTPEQAYGELQAAWSGKAAKEPDKPGWGPTKEGMDESGNPIVYRVKDDTNEVQIIKGVKPKPKRGLKVYDKDTGALLVDTTGGGGSADMTRKIEGAIEQKIMDGSEQLVRMEAIYAEYKPEYQEIGTRFKAAWTGTKAFLGMGVEEEDRKLLVAFKKYQRKAIENINLYIKELTGAQMSEKEADRLRLAQPDPGEKWYQGDSPPTFEAKMDDVLKTARAAVARYRWYKAKGLGDNEIQTLINKGAAKPLGAIAARL